MDALPALTPETRLVFRSADPEVGAAEFATLCAAVRDWTRVAVLADREMATAGLWQALERSAEAVVPTPVHAHLRAEGMMTAFRMRRLAERLARTVAVFRDHGVPVMLLKGAALGAMRDPSFRVRPMVDLDLLVPSGDLARAERAAADAGWVRTTDPVLLDLLGDAHHRPPFFDPEVKGLRLELHTRMLPADHSFALAEEDLWRVATDAAAPFTGARLPAVTHQVLHACTHFAWSHTMRFGAWRTFRTVHVLLRAGEIDWDHLVDAAERTRARTSCYWTLRLARALSGADVPEEVLARLAPPTPSWAVRAIERHFVVLLAPAEGAACPSVRLEHQLWRAALRPKWSGHRQAGRWDPEQRWERAHGAGARPSIRARLVRHLGAAGAWWRFALRTLGPLRRPSSS